jgi:hypothetical protein
MGFSENHGDSLVGWGSQGGGFLSKGAEHDTGLAHGSVGSNLGEHQGIDDLGSVFVEDHFVDTGSSDETVAEDAVI